MKEHVHIYKGKRPIFPFTDQSLCSLSFLKLLKGYSMSKTIFLLQKKIIFPDR